MKVRITDTIEVSHTERRERRFEIHLRRGSVAAFAIASLSRYEPPLAMIIMTRITKIQTSSCTCVAARGTGEQDERDQRDAGDAVGLEAVRASGRPSRRRCRRCSPR